MPDHILAGAAIFVSTISVLILHGVEWYQIGTLLGSRPSTTSIPSNFSSKLMILKGGLGIEAIYYLALLIVFVVFFFSNILFLTLISLLALAHLGAFSAVLSKTANERLQRLTTRSVTGVLLSDVVEVLILIGLAVEFYASFQALL